MDSGYGFRMPFGRKVTLAVFLHRLVALGCIALVLALTLSAACPALHEKLHAGTIGQGEDHCAVALFSTGISAGIAPVTVLPPRNDFLPVALAEYRSPLLVSSRYLRQPERGPPTLG